MKKKPVPTPRRSFPLWLIAVLLVAGIAAAALLLRTPATSTGTQALPADVSPAKALAMRDAGAFVLDVRQPEEWSSGHIPGATLIPLGELPNRLAEVPTDQDVVVVCRSGNRSAQARDILKGAGYTHVTSMAGGMNDWAAAGYPTVTGP